jgi:SAM-dependent methyltransferase
MSFSKEWEQRYFECTHLSIWPWSDVVSLVHRYCKSMIASEASVLEMGCGAGANIPLFMSLGFDFKAVDGSELIVKNLHQRYPELIDQIVCGDFTIEQPFGGNFDLVLDRASITHNSTKSIRSALKVVLDSLKSGGIFIGVDWFSINHSDFTRGIPVEDDYTRTDFAQGQFSGVGKVHFSDEIHLRKLFSDFEIIFLEEKMACSHEPKTDHQFASWNIVARKPYA